MTLPRTLCWKRFWEPEFWVLLGWISNVFHKHIIKESYYVCLVMSDSCNPIDCSLPGSSVHGILQARILEWAAILFSRGSSQPKDWTQVSHIEGRFFTIWATIYFYHGSTWILEWVVYPFSRRSSWPRNWTGVSCMAGRFFTSWATREARTYL